MTLKQVEEKIKKIKIKFLNIEKMRPGNITKQFNVCGTSGCACKDKKNPKKHGPYFKLNYQHQGKSRTVFVKEENVKKITKENNNYRLFKKLTQMWITLEIERSNLELKSESPKILI